MSREAEVRLMDAYRQMRRRVQWVGFVAALVALGVVTLVAVTGGPWWAVVLFTLCFVFDTVLASGWVPRRYRFVLPLTTRRLPNRADHQ